MQVTCDIEPQAIFNPILYIKGLDVVNVDLVPVPIDPSARCASIAPHSTFHPHNWPPQSSTASPEMSQLKTLILHGHYGSPNPTKTMVILQELELPFEVVSKA